jgi:hypothetical protein
MKKRRCALGTLALAYYDNVRSGYDEDTLDAMFFRFSRGASHAARMSSRCEAQG